MKVNQTIIAEWFSTDQFGQRSHYILMNQERGKSSFKLLIKTATINIAAINQLKDEIINRLFATQTQKEYFELFISEMNSNSLNPYFSHIVEVSCPDYELLKPRVKCWANEFMSNYEASFQRQADSARHKLFHQHRQDFEQEVFGSSFSI